MNTKTTLVLAVTLSVLVALYFSVVASRPALTSADQVAAQAAPASAVTRDLLPKRLGDVVKVSYRRKGAEEWVFEKDTAASKPGQTAWKMTKPVEMPCVAWEVDQFGRMVGGMQYEIGFKAGDPGAVKPAEAGLDPPEAVVMLTDTGGQTATVEIGKPGPRGGTYVRLAGSDTICVGKNDLKRVLKTKPIDYRDTQLWMFENANVTRVEIDDRANPDTPVDYVFVRDGAKWMMHAPVTARATSKVDDMLTVMKGLRVTQWADDDPAKLKVYGLETAPLTVRVTVQEPAKGEDAAGADKEGAETETPEEKPAEAAPKKTVVHELRFSALSPIGEDTKTYVRPGSGNAVGSIMKSTVDKFRPSMTEWREMRVITATVNDTTRIEWKNQEGETVLVKKDGAWTFETDGTRAETAAVTDLLKAVGGLTAVAFTDNERTDEDKLGFDKPQAEIRLTIPGVEGVESIVIGNLTDETTKRLVYLRRGEGGAIAKVRAADIGKLTENPARLRERAVVDVVPARFERVVVSYDNPFVPGRETVEFRNSGGQWTMIAPVTAEVRQDQVKKLVETLGGLRGDSIVAEASEASAYGLGVGGSAIGVLIEHRVVGEAEQPDAATAAPGASVVPMALAVSQHDGKYYAMRQDGEVIYEVKKDVYQQLMAEYRTDRILSFEESKVRRFAIRRGQQTIELEKKGERWVCTSEPDLPLDGRKVQNLLVQIRDLRTPRYVRNAATDLSPFGLSSAEREVTVSLDDGRTLGMLVSDSLSEGGGEKGHFGIVAGSQDVFLLPVDMFQRIGTSLEQLE